MKPTRWLMAVTAAAAAGLTGGCLQLDANLELQADGNGQLHLVYAMRKPIIVQVQAMQTLGRQLDQAGGATNVESAVEELDIPVVFDEATIREKFKPFEGQGVKLNSLVIRSRNEWQVVDLVIGFDSLDKLLALPFFRDCAVSLKRAQDGAFRLAMQGPDLGGSGPFPNLSDDATSRNLSPMLAGLTILVRANVPGDIRNTNAARSDLRRATWEYDYDRDPKGFERFGSIEKSRMVVAFSGSGLYLKDVDKPAAPRPAAK